MKIRKSLIISLLTVYSVLVPDVANAVTDLKNKTNTVNNEKEKIYSPLDLIFSDTLKNESINSKKTIDAIKLNLNTIIKNFELNKIVHSGSETYTEDFNNKDKKILDKMKEIYAGKDLNKTFENSKQKNNILFSHSDKNDAFAISFNDACIVNMKIDEDGFGVKMEYDEYKDKKFSENLKINEKDKDLYNEFIIRHEISHCRFTDYAQPFVVSKNKVNNDFMNSFLLNSGAVTSSSAVSMISEAYADSLAAIQMMVKYGVNNKTLNQLLSKVHTFRETIAIDESDRAVLNSHDLHDSIKLLLTKEYKEKISKITQVDSSLMEEMALEVSNKALVFKLSHLDKYDQRLIFSLDNIQKAAIDMVSLEVFKENVGDFKRGIVFESVNSKINNAEGLLKDIVQEYIEEMKKTDRYEKYKEALIKISETTQSSDQEAIVMFAMKKNPYFNTIKLEQLKLSEFIDQKSKDKFDFSVSVGSANIMKELQGYEFSKNITSDNRSDILAKRAKENYTEDNVKSFNFPIDISEKMQKIHNNIILNNKELLSKTGPKL